VIRDLVVFGATGDLAQRFLLPALARLLEHGDLPSDFTMTGAAQVDWDDETFREHVAGPLRTYAHDVPPRVIDELLKRPRYHEADVTNPESMAALLGRFTEETIPDEQHPVAVYLALPVQAVPAAITALKSVDLPSGSRIVVEKPFGEDLAGAIVLNVLLDEVTARAGGRVDVFRVDHVLGMEGLPALRFQNRILGSPSKYPARPSSARLSSHPAAALGRRSSAGRRAVTRSSGRSRRGLRRRSRPAVMACRNDSAVAAVG
jgi:glucose-6-phosphate 1-dehydrogenase